MSIYDENGIMVFPIPEHFNYKKSSKILVFEKCFCPNGHNLINERANFSGYNGIMLKVKSVSDSGLLFLSPIYGDKSRLAFEIKLNPDELYSTLEKSYFTIFAYHQNVLIGSGRVMSDGVLHAMIYEMIVLPQYQNNNNLH